MDAKVIDQENRFSPETGVIPTLSPLSIELADERLLPYINDLEKRANEHWNKEGPDGFNLKERRKQNLKYLLGKQLIGRDLKKYESEFVDNVIGESEDMLKALATSKMPDIIVTAGGIGQNPQRKETAELLSKSFEKEIDSDAQKHDMGIMFRQLPAYLIAVRKYRFDTSKEKLGKYIEEVINPDHILLDHTALTANPDEMLFIIHYVEKTAKEWIMLFPKKKKEILDHVAKANPKMERDEEKNDVLMAQKVRVAEVWYDWFDEAEDFDPEAPNYNFVSGVCWKLSETVLLGKSKNPNWDYEGHDVPMINGEPVDPQMMEQMILTGQQPQGYEIKKVFNNYFKFPRKPFIFMNYYQMLRSAIDETSRIEQQVPLQKSHDDVERQVDYMVKHHKGKHIWGSDSGVDKKNLKKMDMDNPDVDAVVKGDPNRVHAFIQPVMPPADMYNHVANRRDRIFAKGGVHGATRGEVTTDVATTNQISREADFTKNDDIFNETILHVATESVKARLHIMKLRYTEEHWKQVAGIEEGKYLHLRLNNDSIDDGMEVVVKASTSDKLRAERNSQTMASLGMVDPYFFMKDLGIPNVEERVEALFLYQSNPALWFEKFGKGKNLTDLANQVIQGAMPGQPAQMGGMIQPQAPAPTAQPSPQDTSNIATEPQGSPNMLQRAVSGVKGLIGL